MHAQKKFFKRRCQARKIRLKISKITRKPIALTYECSKNKDDANDDESLDGGESLSLRDVIRNTGTVLQFEIQTGFVSVSKSGSCDPLKI
jgi:hypothetical protein